MNQVTKLEAAPILKGSLSETISSRYIQNFPLYANKCADENPYFCESTDYFLKFF